MAGSGSIPNEDVGRLKWKCDDIDCTHRKCLSKSMWSDNGEVEIFGTMRWNADDKKWDWSVRVDHYGSSEMTQLQTEEMASRHARRMATQVGLQFRGPKVTSIHALDD
jgi:hypothetical protein